MDTIHVALASDNNYFEGLLVTAWTIARYCSRSSDITFHILNGGISQDNLDFLHNTIAPMGSSLDLIAIDQDVQLKGFGTWHGNSSMAYARLLLPDLLPAVHHIIYTDVDFIWLGDIAKLWAKRKDDLLLQHVSERAKGRDKISDVELQWATERGMTFNHKKYFCTGMLLMNLDMFRKEDLHKKVIRFLLENNGTAPYADQTALNLFTAHRNDTGYLTKNWQTETGDPVGCAVNDDLAIHYAGDTPWKSIQLVHHMLTDSHILWHHIHAQLRGISIWKSLRSYNSALGIFFSRILYLLASNSSAVRSLIRLYMKLRYHAQDTYYLDSYMSKVKFARYKL